jgi:hypothetical protein
VSPFASICAAACAMVSLATNVLSQPAEYAPASREQGNYPIDTASGVFARFEVPAERSGAAPRRHVCQAKLVLTLKILLQEPKCEPVTIDRISSQNSGRE